MTIPSRDSRDVTLAKALDALSSPTRLALLRALRAPKALAEIHVPAGEGDEDRPLARQTVKEHLEKLVLLGFVAARDAERDARATTEYVVNHQRVFAVAEELRTYAALRPTAEPEGETLAREPDGTFRGVRGPCLVLVKGIEEGRAWPLSTDGGPRRWVIGRRRGVDVALDFDPFLSTENTVVACEGGAFTVEDLADSRNGTFLNFELLPKGRTWPLRAGDIVGVGRTLLLFRA